VNGLTIKGLRIAPLSKELHNNTIVLFLFVEVLNTV